MNQTSKLDGFLPLIVLIPAIICTIALFRMSIQKVLLNVFLPIFTLVPVYYFWKVKLLPPIDFAEAVLLPLGIAILIKEWRRWHFTRSDLWLTLFFASACYPDLRNGDKTASIFILFTNLCLAFVPYAIGKLVIETHGGRIPFLKRLLTLLSVSCVIAFYEYRMGRNPFTILMAPFFPDEHFAWKTQIRWGHGRVSGPFGQSELAGMMLFFGIVLALYLAYYHLWEPRFANATWLPIKKSTTITVLIGSTLLLTQARGPWLGALVAIPLALIGRARNIRRMTSLFLAVCLVCGPLAYVGMQNYTSATAPGSAEQETAAYRAKMLDNYIPIAIAGGATGWGKDFPRVWGQDSIDNEYLFVALTQGYVGFFAFSLIGIEAVIDLIAASAHGRTRHDRYFAFSLLGVFVGILVTVFTVFLGNQPYQLFFLLAGWAQALRPRSADAPEFAFRQVYT